jgi:hypothetical protein
MYRRLAKPPALEGRCGKSLHHRDSMPLYRPTLEQLAAIYSRMYHLKDKDLTKITVLADEGPLSLKVCPTNDRK